MSITAAAAAQIVSDALKALNAVRERAKTSRDSALKEQISALYDTLLPLKEAVIRFTEEITELKRENAELKRQVVAPRQKPEPELRQVGAVNYYFVGEKGPFCQRCYDGNGKLFALTPVEEWNEGLRRKCLQCKELFYEKPMDLGAAFAIVNRA
jgi:regulator of replication initiation timing